MGFWGLEVSKSKTNMAQNTTHSVEINDSFVSQHHLRLANTGDRLRLAVEDAIWVWLPEAEVWFQLEGYMADRAEMTEHIRGTLEGSAREAALECADCSRYGVEARPPVAGREREEAGRTFSIFGIDLFRTFLKIEKVLDLSLTLTLTLTLTYHSVLGSTKSRVPRQFTRST